MATFSIFFDISFQMSSADYKINIHASAPAQNLPLRERAQSSLRQVGFGQVDVV